MPGFKMLLIVRTIPSPQQNDAHWNAFVKSAMLEKEPSQMFGARIASDRGLFELEELDPYVEQWMPVKLVRFRAKR